MDNLPAEMHYHIAWFLDQFTLVKLRQVNHYWKEIANYTLNKHPDMLLFHPPHSPNNKYPTRQFKLNVKEACRLGIIETEKREANALALKATAAMNKAQDDERRMWVVVQFHRKPVYGANMKEIIGPVQRDRAH